MHDAAVSGGSFQARVTAADQVASGVVRIRLAALAGGALPSWSPGAHIDIVLPDGLVRQYSLCGDPADLSQYEIAVLREVESRGGSRQLHEPGICGAVLGVRAPRNHFVLEAAPAYVFIAGGIGVTPLLPMVRQAAADGVPWRFVYGGRTRAAMAFVAELATLAAGGGGTLDVVTEDETGSLDLEGILSSVGPQELVYCCGPEGLLIAVEELCATRTPGRLRVERFGAPTGGSAAPEVDGADRPVVVELQRSGLIVDVPSDRTILAVVEEVLPDVMYS